jgi:cytochrome P450
MSFRPERFLGGDPAPDPHQFVFGFGRRVCPGRILADNALFLNVAQSLAVFNIDKPVVHGKVVEPAVKFTSGVVSHPEPYKADIKPRSAQHEALIRGVEETHPWQESDSKVLESMK